MAYNDNMDADQQITAEEGIAVMLRDFQEGQIELDEENGVEDHTLTEEDCQLLSQHILLRILSEFRPDLTT